MREKRSCRLFAVAWTLSILAVLLLYVLTLPWIYVSKRNVTIHKTSLSNEDIEFMVDPLRSGPAWLIHYSKPYLWLAQTPLKAPLEHYWRWCLTEHWGNRRRAP